VIISINFGASSGLTTLETISNIFLISPNPSNLLTKDFGSNSSKSLKCSPVPIKIIGDSVAATALKEPPPLA